MTLNALLKQLQNSEKPYYSKGEIINLVEKMIPKKEKIVESNGVVVDLEKYVISYNGMQSTFPRKVTELTYYLITNFGRTVKREEILSEVWGDDVIVSDRTIDVHIRKIRQALNFDCIKTIKGVGYQWN
jgi:two-component system alkaline phosphatase synthesis response regulator PhoP